MMDPETSDATVASAPVPIVPSKRKRGRPRKMLLAANMAMFTAESQTALVEIPGPLEMEHRSEPPVVDVVVSIDPVEDVASPAPPLPLALPIVSTSPSPIVKKSRGPGRPRKHPLPPAPLDDAPKIKRKRGRPPKANTPPLELVATEMGLAEPMTTESATLGVTMVMLVPPLEVVTEPAQVNIAQIPVSTGISQDTKAETLVQPLSGGGVEFQQTLEKPAQKKLGRPRKHPPPDPNAVKRSRGRPKKVPVTSKEVKPPPPIEKKQLSPESVDAPLEVEEETTPDPNAVKRRGRPQKVAVTSKEVKPPPPIEKKQPPPESVDAPPEVEETTLVKKARGRPRKHPLQADSTEKRPRGQLKKNPGEPVVKKNRGRPRKNPLPAIPESFIPPLPAISPDGALSEKPSASSLNASSDTSKHEAFNLILSSESESDDYTVANSVAMLKKHSKETSPLLDDRFVESSDEDD